MKIIKIIHRARFELRKYFRSVFCCSGLDPYYVRSGRAKSSSGIGLGLACQKMLGLQHAINWTSLVLCDHEAGEDGKMIIECYRLGDGASVEKVG